MTETQFLQRLAEVLMADRAIARDTPLESLSGWDSMGQVALVAMLDETLHHQLPPGTLQGCKRVGDIVALIGQKLDAADEAADSDRRG